MIPGFPILGAPGGRILKYGSFKHTFCVYIEGSTLEGLHLQGHGGGSLRSSPSSRLLILRISTNPLLVMSTFPRDQHLSGELTGCFSVCMLPSTRAAAVHHSQPEPKRAKRNEFILFLFPALTRLKSLTKPSEGWVDICPTQKSPRGRHGAWKGFTGLI